MTSFYEIITEPADSPINLAEAKDWAKIDLDITKDDELIQGLIRACTDFGERYTARVFMDTEFQGMFDCLEMSTYENSQFIDIERAPLATVSVVEIFNNDAWEAFTDYQVKPTHGYTRLLFPNGVIVSDYNVPYLVRVTFTAGYADKDAVPESIKTGVKEHVLFFYANRGDTKSDAEKNLPVEVKAFYAKYAIRTVY